MSKFRRGRRFLCELQNLLATLSRPPQTISLYCSGAVWADVYAPSVNAHERNSRCFGGKTMMYYLWLNEWKWTDGESAVMGAPGSRANIRFLTISAQLSVTISSSSSSFQPGFCRTAWSSGPRRTSRSTGKRPPPPHFSACKWTPEP